MSSKRQFSVRGLLLWAILFATCCVFLRIFRECRSEAVCWSLATTGACIARVPGAWAGRVLGSVAHHALAWFFGVTGGTVAILFLNARYLPKEFWDGVFASSLIGGILVGTVVELIVLPYYVFRGQPT